MKYVHIYTIAVWVQLHFLRRNQIIRKK